MAQERVIPSATTTHKKPKAGKLVRERIKEIKTSAFFKQMYDNLFSDFRKVAAAARSGWSRYTPHQGAQEKVRRMRQIERGIIRVTGGA